MFEAENQVTECKRKEHEQMLRLQGQLERTQRGDDEELECEVELRRERQHLQRLQRKTEISRQPQAQPCKMRDRMNHFAMENYKMKVAITQLRRDHELKRCYGTACHDYEDAMLSLSDALGKNINHMKSKLISQAAIDRLMKQIEEKVISMLVLSENVYLYKNFGAHPEILAPEQMKNSSLEKMIVCKHAQAESRVKRLTDECRRTAKDVRLAEEAIATARKVTARKDRSRKTPLSQPARWKEDPQPLIHPGILKIVEEDFAQLMPYAEEKTAPVTKGSEEMRSVMRVVALCEPLTKE